MHSTQITYQYSQQSTQEQISDYNKTVKPTLTTTKQTGKTSQLKQNLVTET